MKFACTHSSRIVACFDVFTDPFQKLQIREAVSQVLEQVYKVPRNGGISKTTCREPGSREDMIDVELIAEVDTGIQERKDGEGAAILDRRLHQFFEFLTRESRRLPEGRHLVLAALVRGSWSFGRR